MTGTGIVSRMSQAYDPLTMAVMRCSAIGTRPNVGKLPCLRV